MEPIILTNEEEDNLHSTKSYRFKGFNTSHRWPMVNGRNLGLCGMWNFLWRLGFYPKQVNLKDLPQQRRGKILFVDKASINETEANTLNKWLKLGNKIIATGELAAWKNFLPPGSQWKTSTFNNPHAALAYIVNDSQAEIVSPPQWSFIEGHNFINKNFIGNVAAIQGERQTPCRAEVLLHANAPAVIQNNYFFYFNGHPFAAFQAWLQGQENLSTWFAWRHRLFWLDEWVSFFYDLMLKLDIFSMDDPRPALKELNKTTIILRHDLDYSRELTFLKLENKRNISATYALLKDRNTKYWLNQLKDFKNHEIAFHYNTGKRNWQGLIKYLFTKKHFMPFKPDYSKISGNGLLKQLKWAQKKGVAIQTIHRHLSFLIYPEWIDALDTVYESNLNVLGSSSLFRGQVLKWGIEQIEGINGFIAEWPDNQFPFWYPFKLAHAAKNGKVLKGWEMTSVMEIEPYMLSQLLNHRVKHLSHFVFTLNFHPAHTLNSSFYSNGSYENFVNVLNILHEKNADIMNMAAILNHINKIQDLNE